ncbi:MAG: M56 family metallopeptidase [Planctomycetota bacterium]|nr:MAG: M56 family metallopeptidase [Planctomycetota bacterium]
MDADLLLVLRGPAAAALCAWLLACALQSSLWLSGAWLWQALRPGAQPRTRETVWKLALAASVLGPSVQSALGIVPLAGRWSLPVPAAGVGAGAGAHPPAAVLPPGQPRTALMATPGSIAASAPAPEVVPAPARVARAPAIPEPGPAATWTEWAASLWLLFAAAGSVALAAGALRFRLCLRRRTPLRAGPAADRLAALLARCGARAPVRLSVATALEAPVSFGLLRREICLPPRALAQLSPAQQGCLLGHELAHHLRRDPLWLLLFACAEKLLFFQPLLRRARRSAEEAAEESCDAWAAAHAGDGVAMASCLAEVAGWLQPAGRPAPVPGMARAGAPLTRRIERLLHGARDLQLPAGALWTAGLLSLALAAAAAPGFTLAPARPPAPAVQPRVHAIADPFAAALADLDAELDALEREAASFAAELAQTPRAAELAPLLAGVQARLAALRSSRQALADCLPAPQDAVSPAGPIVEPEIEVGT